MEDTWENRLTLWAARVLGISVESIAKVDTDWWGLCETCEYSRGEITVTLSDGRRFHGENTFGLFLNEIVELDLNADGTLSSYAYDEEPFVLNVLDVVEEKA